MSKKETDTKASATANSGLLVPFVLDNIPIRGKFLRIENLAQHVPSLDNTSNVVTKSIAELLTGGAVMVNELKEGANVTLQIHSPGSVPLMVGRCNHLGELKAFAHIDDETTSDELDFNDISKDNSTFVVTVDYGKSGNRHQSIVELNNTSVMSSIESYFTQSVQSDTYFKVFTGKSDGKISVGCLFLQAMPGAEKVSQDDWHRLGLILSTIQMEEILPGQLTPDEVLFRLFAEDTVRVFPKQPLSFAVPNTRERMLGALKQIGAKACKDLLDDGTITMTCEYTGQEESFTEDDLKDLFKDNWDS